MADSFRRVPVEAEVTPGNRQIRGHGQFLAAARSQQGTVVADAQPKAGAPAAGARCPAANLAEQGKFACSAGDSGIGLFHAHLLRIGRKGEILAG
jgi:hypothetical protein